MNFEVAETENVQNFVNYRIVQLFEICILCIPRLYGHILYEKRFSKAPFDTFETIFNAHRGKTIEKKILK